MKAKKTSIEGCYILQPNLYEDNRGVFFESYNQTIFENIIGRRICFVQDNISISHKGVLRGLHFQKGIYAQAKLIQVLKGKVLDVVVDIRKGSPTFGEHFKMNISAKNRTSIFMPKGIAHGFLALTDEVIFNYKCDSLYNPKAEGGILYNDPELCIDWEVREEELILSEKDLKLPLLKDLNL